MGSKLGVKQYIKIQALCPISGSTKDRSYFSDIVSCHRFQSGVKYYKYLLPSFKIICPTMFQNFPSGVSIIAK
jgi:hypothetical protein